MLDIAQSLLIVLDRVSAAGDDGAVFGADEFAEWPDDLRQMLESAGLLARSQPASTVVCDGCERNCPRPVEFVDDDECGTPRAFVECLWREDVTAVAIADARLNRWRLSPLMIARFFARQLGASLPTGRTGGIPIQIRVLQGKRGTRSVTLARPERRIELTVGGRRLELTEVIRFDTPAGNIVADVDHIKRVADLAAVPASERYKRDTSQREERKADTRHRYAAWRREKLRLRKEHPGMSDKDISKIIAGQEIGNGCDPETIRKRM